MEKSLMKKKTKKMVYKKGRTVRMKGRTVRMKGRTVRMKVRPVDRIDYEKLAKNITVM